MMYGPSYTLVPHQVVEILSTATIAPSYGSGYLLAPDLAMTAAHVVGTNSEVWVRFGCSPKDPTLRYKADVAWRGDVVDIAIVQLRKSAELGHPISPARLGEIVPTGEKAIPFVAVGFPAHKQYRRPGGRMLRDSDHVRGEILTAANAKSGRIDLVRNDAPLEFDEAWKGLSGAAVFAHGFLVGVAVEVEDGGRLVCERIGAALGVRPSALAEYREPPENVARLHKIFEGAGVRTEPARVVRRSSAAYLPRSARSPLLDRDRELDRLRSFAKSRRGWELWIGEPWSGKSALAAHFAADPPPDVDLVYHFVSARELRGDTQDYARGVSDQLAALLDEPAVPAADVGLLDDLWGRAAVQAQLAGRQLVLIVDGLDENTDGLPIAAALPLDTPPHSHVVLFSRQHPDVRELVDRRHPLRTCDVVLLPPSPHANDIRDKAIAELNGLLDREGEAAKIVLSLLAVAGPMSMRELAEVGQFEGVSLDRITLERVLERRAGRVVELWAGTATDACYELAHEQLRQGLAEKVADTVPRHLAAMHAWADNYADRGWSDPDVPDYLVERYPRLLVALRDGDRLARLSTASRVRFLRAQTGDDQAAVIEHDAAWEFLLRMGPNKVDRLAPLALRRDVLRSGLTDVPVEVALAWGVLGRWKRARNLAMNLDEQERIHVAVAAAAEGAYDIAREIGETISQEEGNLRPMLALAAATNGDVELAQTLAATLKDPLACSQTLAAVASQLGARTDLSSAILKDAMTAASAVHGEAHRALALAGIAAASAAVGDGDVGGLINQAVEAARPAGSAEAWLGIAMACMIVGQIDLALEIVAWLPADIVGPAFDGLVLSIAKAPGPPDHQAALAAIAAAEANEGDGRQVALLWAATRAADLGDAALAGRLLDAAPRDGEAESLTLLAKATALVRDFPRALRLVEEIEDPEEATSAILGVLELCAAKGTATTVPGMVWDTLLAAVTELEDGPAVEALCRGIAVAAVRSDSDGVDRLLGAALVRANSLPNWEAMEEKGGFAGLLGIIGGLQPGTRRADVVTMIAGAAAAAGRPHVGEDLAGELRDGRARARVLAAVVVRTVGEAEINRQQLVEDAEAALRSEADIRPAALRAISLALAERGDPERARDVASGIPEPETRMATLAAVAERLADRGELELANMIAEELEQPDFRCPALCRVARAAHNQGNMELAQSALDRAQACIAGLGGYDRLSAGFDLPPTALYVGDYLRAVSIANSDPRWRIGDLATAARAAAEDGEGVLAAEIVDGAEAILADGVETFASALASLAQAAHAIDRHSRAHGLLLQAMELAEREADGIEKVRALTTVVAAAFKMGDPSAEESLAAAQTAAGRLTSEYNRGSALVDLVQALADARAVDAAARLARSIQSATEKARAKVVTIRASIAAERQDLASALFEEAERSVVAADLAEQSVILLLDLAEVAHDAGFADRGATLAKMAAEAAAIDGSGLGLVVERVATDLERSQLDPRPFLTRACVTMSRHTPELYSAMIRLEPDLVGPLLDVLDEGALPSGASS